MMHFGDGRCPSNGCDGPLIAENLLMTQWIIFSCLCSALEMEIELGERSPSHFSQATNIHSFIQITL